MAARLVWDQEVPGSNPGSPTNIDIKQDKKEDINNYILLSGGKYELFRLDLDNFIWPRSFVGF